MRSKRFLSITLALILGISSIYSDFSYASETAGNIVTSEAETENVSEYEYDDETVVSENDDTDELEIIEEAEEIIEETEETFEETPVNDEELKWQNEYSGEFGEGFSWRIGPSSSQETESRTLYISGTGVMPDFTDISAYDTKTNAPWNQYSDVVTSIVIESGITHVSKKAFMWMGNASKATLPEGVVSIGEKAFDCSDLRTVNIPSTLTTVASCGFGAKASNIYVDTLEHWLSIDFADDEANPIFVSNSQADVYHGKLYVGDATEPIDVLTIPSSITTLKPYTIGGFKTVVIPTTVKKLEANSVYCVDAQIVFEGSCDNYEFCKDWNYDLSTPYPVYLYTDPQYTESWETMMTSLGEGYYWREDEPYELADFIFDNYGIIWIWEKSGILHIFYEHAYNFQLWMIEKHRRAKKVIIHEGIPTISTYGFGYSAQYPDWISVVEDLTLPSSLTAIEKWAFQNVAKLKELVIPASSYTIEIGEQAFLNSSIETLYLEKRNTKSSSIAADAFEGCGEITIYYEENCGWESFATGNYGAEKINWIPVVTDGEHKYANFTRNNDGNCSNNETETGHCVLCRTASLTREIPDSKVSSVHKFEDHLVDLGNGNGYYLCDYGCGLTSFENSYAISNEGTCGANLSYKVYGNYMYITGTGAMTDFDTDSLPVWRTYDIKYVVVGDGVTSVGNLAFENMTSVEYIGLADSVTTIGSYAFNGCTSLKQVVLPVGCTELKSCAFAGCTSLTRVTAYPNLKTIAPTAFSGCPSNTVFAGFEGSYFIEYATGKGFTTELIGSSGSTTDYNWYYIGDKLFITVTGEDATFTADSLPAWQCFEAKTVVLDSTYVAPYMFYKMDSIETIEFVEPITSLGDYAFTGCTQIKTINTLEISEIPDGAFAGCSSLTSAGDLSGVVSVGNKAFSGCVSFEELSFISNVTAFGKYAFEGCTQLTSVTLNDSLEYISDGLFMNCSELTTITYNENVYAIGEWAFAFTKNSEVKLTNSLKIVGTGAFAGCPVTELHILANYTGSFKPNAFAYCANLETITIDEGNNKYTVRNNVLYNSTGQVLLLYPAGKKNKTFDVGLDITGIGSYAFAGNEYLEKITLRDGMLTSIGEFAFSKTGIKTITIPASVQFLEKSTFAGADKLESVIISEDNSSYTSDSKYFIYDKEGTKLYIVTAGATELELPENIEITENAFKYCNPNLIVDVSYDTKRTCDLIDFADGVSVRGYENGPAAYFAKNNGLNFISIGKKEVATSDNKAHVIASFPKLVTWLRTLPNATYSEYSSSSRTTSFTMTYIPQSDSVKCYYSSTMYNAGAEDTQAVYFFLTAEGVSGSKFYFDDTTNDSSYYASGSGYADVTKVDSGYDVKFTVRLSSALENMYTKRGEDGAAIFSSSASAKLDTLLSLVQNTLTEKTTLKLSDLGFNIFRVSSGDFHTYTTVGKKDATCLENGYTGDKVCTICNATVKGEVVYPKHTFTEPYVEPATTEQDGHYGYKCSGCETKSDSSTLIRKIGSAEMISEFVTYEQISGLGVKVTDADRKAISTDYYTVSYSNTDKVGGGVATITFKEHYAGTLKIHYFITPADAITVTAEQTESSVNLSWNEVRGVTSFLVEREEEGSVKTALSCVSGNDYEDSTVENGKKYKYTVSNIYGYDKDNVPQVLGFGTATVTFGSVSDVSENDETYYTIYFYDRGSEITHFDVKEGDVIDFTMVQLPANPGYIFHGWYIDDVEIDYSYVVTKGVTITARWEKAEEDISGNEPDDPEVPGPHEHNFVEVTNEDGTVTITCSGCEYRRDILWGDVAREDAEALGYTVKTIPTGFWVSGISDSMYTGKGITFPNLHVYRNKKLLKAGTDYTIKYTNNTNVADTTAAKAPTVTITFKGNYSGSIVRKFVITRLDITENPDFTADPIVVVYNGTVQRKNPVLKWKGKALTLNKDYRVVFDTSSTSVYKDVNEEGYLITIEGMGRFTGNLTAKEIVTDKKLISQVTIATIAKQNYAFGEEIKPALTVKLGKTVTLTAGVDYEATYSNNIECGTATVTIKGIGNYYGTKTATFKIVGTDISKGRVLNLKASVTYTGTELTQDNLVLQIKSGKTYVDVPADGYTVTYSNNLKAGKATVTFTGKGQYTGTLKKTFTIAAYDLAKDNGNLISVSYPAEVEYAKNGAKPVPVVSFYDVNSGENVVLKEGTDYTLSYKNNTAVNDGSNPKKVPTIVIKGKGNFSGTRAKENFVITSKNIGLGTITTFDVVATGKAGNFMAVPTITDVNGAALKVNTDFSKTEIKYYYTENLENVKHTLKRGYELINVSKGEQIAKNAVVPAGTRVDVVVSGRGNYYGTISSSFRMIDVKADISKAKVYISDKLYYGESVELEKSDICIVVNGITLSDADYEIAGYLKNNGVGKATVKLQGVGNYGGTKNATFVISKTHSNYNVRFHANGGVGTMKVKTSNSASVALGKLGYQRTGYSFTGWNTSPDGSGESYSAIYDGGENIVDLYAQWQLTGYTINYVIDADVDNSMNPATYTVEDDTIVLADPVRNHYTFKGWYSDSKYKNKVTQILKGSTGNRVLYPKWEAKGWAIDYYVNDCKTSAIYVQMMKFGKSDKLFTGSTIKRNGFTLKGFSTRYDGRGDFYLPGQEVKDLVDRDYGNIKLYAQWDYNGYELGETWTVPGNYSFRVDKVEVHKACNSKYPANSVVLVTYTYTNINWVGASGIGLMMSGSDVKVYDENGSVGSRYYHCSHDKSPTIISSGGSCTATVAYELNTSSPKNITVEASKYYSSRSSKYMQKDPSAKFFIPLVKGTMHYLAEDVMEIGTYADGKYVYDDPNGDVTITFDVEAQTVNYRYFSNGDTVSTEVYFTYDLTNESFGQGIYADVHMNDGSAYVRGWASNFGYGYYYDKDLKWSGQKLTYNESQLDTYVQMAILWLSAVAHSNFDDTIEKYGFILQ